MKLVFSFLILAATQFTSGANMNSIYEIETKTLTGKPVKLSEYKGKTLLIVNVASKCGYTKQYDGLEKLYTKYKDKGLVVLGFPSNDFGAQEPGSNDEIAKFCKLTYGVNFPMFTKGPVSGDSKQELYKYLTSHAPKGHEGEVKWNFEKFLISPTGEIKGRFLSKVEPESKELVTEIEKSLSK